MSLSRRDFMKLFGVAAASLLLTRCRGIGFPVACYAPLPPPTQTPTDLATLPGRRRLQACWYSFDVLAAQTLSGENAGNDAWDDPLGQELSAQHRSALDELVAAGELSAPTADLVQEAYDAALYHVWRSNVPITCYEPVVVDYAPAGADSLVRQAEALEAAAAAGTIDPGTLADARVALEHDLAYYALSNADVQALYDRILAGLDTGTEAPPSFEELELEQTPEAQAAADFILELLVLK
jgi:hypothetical protein